MSAQPDRILPDRILLVLEPVQALPIRVRPLVEAGAGWFWLRAKTLPPAEVEGLLDRLLPALGAARLSLGGHPQIAAARGLGCHLPEGEALPAVRPPLLGCSTHDAAGAGQALAAGADYVTFSPIFPPLSKTTSQKPLGLAALSQVAAAHPGRVLALGGLTPERALQAIQVGAAGVGLAGGVLSAADPAAALGRYRAALAA